MKKQKTDKGITLIALIITIVVLLIIAVVTVGAVKESDIIAHAETAKSEYSVAQEKENLQLAISEAILAGKGNATTANLDTSLKEIFKDDIEIDTTSSENFVKVKIKSSDREWKVYLNGTIKEDVPHIVPPIWEARGLTSEYVQFDKEYYSSTIDFPNDESSNGTGTGIKLSSDGSFYFIVTNSGQIPVDNATVEDSWQEDGMGMLIIGENFISISYGGPYIAFEFVEEGAKVYYGRYDEDDTVRTPSDLEYVGTVTVQE